MVPPGLTKSRQAPTRSIAAERDGSSSERIEKGQERVAVRFGQTAKGFAGGLRLAAVPKDCFSQVSRPAIVQKERVAVHRGNQTDAPQWRCAPVISHRLDNRPMVG